MMPHGSLAERWLRPRCVLISGAVLASYALTWVLGWGCHARRLARRADEMYRGGQAKHARMVAMAAELGTTTEGLESALRPEGPVTRVNWCVPLLPGVLLADSQYLIGPRWARGGIKIVVWFLFGSREVMLSGWVS